MGYVLNTQGCVGACGWCPSLRFLFSEIIFHKKHARTHTHTYKPNIFCVGPTAQSVYRLATGWTVRGSNSGVGRDFPPIQTGPGAHPASCTMGTGSFPGVKYGRAVLLTTHPLLVPWSWKSRAIAVPPSGPQPGL